MGVERSKRTAEINSWKPKDSQEIVKQDGKLFICNFDKLLGFPERMNSYKIFIIGKESYTNQLDIITKYINYFMNRYDTDNELIMAYLKIKFTLDNEDIFHEDNMEAYIDFIYDCIFTDNITSKIVQLVEDNYLDDIETTDEDDETSRKYVKNEKKHLENLEFKNEHVKILLQISLGMKIMSPVIFHYIQKNNIKITKESEIIFRFYSRLFKIFAFGNDYRLYSTQDIILNEDSLTQNDIDELISKGEVKEPVKHEFEIRYYKDDGSYYCKHKINMYNKLFVYVKAKVLESNANNSIIFEQREIFGVDLFSVINLFIKKVIISENMVKLIDHVKPL